MIEKNIVQSPKNYQFKPMNMTKPPKLALQTLKNKWETFANWSKKFKDYCSTGYIDPEAMEDTLAIRTWMILS